MICIYNTKLDSIIRSIKTAPLLQSGPVDSVIALDPGVSEFLVGYAPDGTVLQVGTNTTKVLDSKTLTCTTCGLEADRDAHAARNILLRTLPCHDDGAKGCDTFRR